MSHQNLCKAEHLVHQLLAFHPLQSNLLLNLVILNVELPVNMKMHHGQWKVNVVELLLDPDCRFVKKQLITLLLQVCETHV